MQAEEVSSIIASDLAENPNFSNSHGLNVQECLVHPQLIELQDGADQGAVIPLWLVLKERRGDEGGYLVVYSEERNMFGLAMCSARRPVFLGFHGSFTETLSGM